MAGKFLRGAFIQFMETIIIPVPNIIIFQFNPEQITHTWTPAKSASYSETDNALAVSGAPGESFNFVLKMDATDMLADGSPVAEGIATVSGISTRIAALEMLMHPTRGGDPGSLLGSVSISTGGLGGALGGVASGRDHPVPANQLPTVLFVWGPGRILPVKLTRLNITEQLYDPTLLNPTHAEATVGLQVLTKREIDSVNGPLAAVSRMAYEYSQRLREVLAVANVANSAESAIGMLPL